MESEKAFSTRLRDADLRLKEAQIQLSLAETNVKESEKVLNEQKTLLIHKSPDTGKQFISLFVFIIERVPWF